MLGLYSTMSWLLPAFFSRFVLWAGSPWNNTGHDVDLLSPAICKGSCSPWGWVHVSSARPQHAQPSAFHTLPVTVSQAVLSWLKEPKLWCPSAPTPPDSGSFPPKLGSESQTVAQKPDVVHCLFSHNLRAKNGFYVCILLLNLKKEKTFHDKLNL